MKMITCYGTWEVRYCVAQVNFFGGKPEVSYYADGGRAYGLCRVSSIDDPQVIWYDNRKEAMDNRINANDCVVWKGRDVKKP